MRVARLAVFLLALVGALLFSHFVIYRGVILPELPTRRSVPTWMWAAVLAPEALVALAGGVGLRTWKAVALYAVTASATRLAVTFVFAAAGYPGYVKGLEAPVLRVVLGLPFLSVVYGALIAAGSQDSRAAARARPTP